MTRRITMLSTLLMVAAVAAVGLYAQEQTTEPAQEQAPEQATEAGYRAGARAGY